MLIRRLLLFVSLVLTGTLLLAACGGDDDSEATPAEVATEEAAPDPAPAPEPEPEAAPPEPDAPAEGAPSKEEFIAKADAICRDASEQEAALGVEPPAQEPEQFEAWALDYQDIGQAALSELRALSPPEQNAETVDEILSNYEAAYASVPDRVAASLGRATGADLAVSQFHSAQVDAAAYGFGDCIFFGLLGLAS